MLNQTRFVLLMLASALAAQSAHASFPGSPEGECGLIGSIRWIAKNTTTVCESDTLRIAPRTTNAFQVGFIESRTVTGETPGSDDPVECVPDFVAGAELRGILTLVASDNAADDNVENDCGTFFENTIALTAILEIEKNGKHLVSARAIAGCGEVDLAPWNNEGDSIERTIFVANPNNSLFGSNLSFESEIYAFAIQTGILPAGSDRTTAPPVLGDDFENVFRKNVPSDPVAPTACTNGCGPDEVDAGGANAHASVARYRVTIRFAKLGSAPSGVEPDFCYP